MPSLLRRASLAALALAVTALAACSSSSPSPAQTLARTVAACRKAAPAKLPAATGQQPGQTRWSASLARCAENSGELYPSAPGTGLGRDTITGPQVWAVTGPGNRLAVLADGVVSFYNTTTGARLWQRAVAPTGQRYAFDDVLQATSSVVLIQFQTAKGPLTMFLNASTGQPLGKTTSMQGDPFLVGSHVIVAGIKAGTLDGYDPATGQTTWRTSVPSPPGTDAPAAQSQLSVGNVLFLDSVTGGTTRSIDRLDVATGKLLTPITLPQALPLDFSTSDGSGLEQGLLVLTTSSGATKTVAVDPACGAVKWTSTTTVNAEPGGLFMDFSQGGSPLVTVSPATGKQAWSLTPAGTATGNDFDPLIATSSYAAEWAQVSASQWDVDGIRPDDSKAWSSARFPQAMFVTSDASTVYVFTCTPWGTADTGVCKDITLSAVAATG